MTLPHQVYDVAVIGAGVIGSAIASVLSRYHVSVVVIEKTWDVGMGASCRNSGVIHSGINYKPGTLRAALCMEGRQLLQAWCNELRVPYRVTGKLVVARQKSAIPELERLHLQGEENGVPGLRVVDEDEMNALQPGLMGQAGLYVPTAGIVSPYALTIALAGDACTNGVRFLLGEEVSGIRSTHGIFRTETPSHDLRSRWLINAGGLHADVLGQMLEDSIPTIHPCRGEYLLLDKSCSGSVAMPVYPIPDASSGGLGAHVTPTVDGNVLIGPSAEYVAGREDYACTSEVSSWLSSEATSLWQQFSQRDVIGSFAGIRAKLTPPDQGGYSDFYIEAARQYPRLVNLVGLESPGLTAAPAIAHYVVNEIMRSKEAFEPKAQVDVVPYHWPRRFANLPDSEKLRLISENPEYGEIICRCEGVTRYEVLQALHNPLGVQTLCGVKYRSRMMMGRCSGGYCFPRLVEIMRKELRCEPSDLRLNGPASWVLAGPVKEDG